MICGPKNDRDIACEHMPFRAAYPPKVLVTDLMRRFWIRVNSVLRIQSIGPARFPCGG
jgi:hypothetical protein